MVDNIDLNTIKKSKRIVRVLVTTTQGEKIVGYVCYKKEYDQDSFLELYEKGEIITVYRLFSPNTGRPEQARYETLTFNQEDVVSIIRHSDIDPEIEFI